jgi:hypothetical protein
MLPNITRLLLTGLIATAALVCAVQAQQSEPTIRPANKILAHALDIESGRVSPRPNEPRLSSGVMYSLLGASGALAKRANANISAPMAPLDFSGIQTQGCSNVFSSGGITNTRVNQDCSLRRQAEEVIAINPTNPDNLIAGQNDSRIGFNKCGYDFSMDGGKTWGDLLPPFYQFLSLDGVTFDACSDPTATFDAAGNAFVGGILFEVNLVDTAIVVAKSNAGIGGAFYHTPAPGPFQEYQDLPLGVVTTDNDPNISNDKELIVADSQPRSIKQNNVYATWTRFAVTGVGVGVNSPIYFGQSTDGGATWSTGIEISGANAAACTAFSAEANLSACDQDQGSHPIVGPDGTVYVAFGNGNTPTAGVNQHMVVSCAPANDCSKSASWTAPVKITDDFGTQPFGPVASTACAPGRQCLPPNGYRLDDFTQGSLSADNSGNLYFVWADFRNGAPNCNPNGAAATATTPCDNDVFYSYSTNGGAAWSAATNLTPKSKFGPTAQWMPWSGVTANGRTLWVAYYDRSYGNCETTGCNDITLAAVKRPATGSPTVTYQRITTASMPNLVVANNPIEAGFLGDYMWLTVDAKGRPNIVWADTRGLHGTVEEDIYFYKSFGDE